MKKVDLAPFGPLEHTPTFWPALIVPSFVFGPLPALAEMTCPFFVLLVMVQTIFALVHLVKLLGLTVSLVGLHFAGAPLMLTLGSAAAEMPVMPTVADGVAAAETGVTAPAIPATLRTPTV